MPVHDLCTLLNGRSGSHFRGSLELDFDTQISQIHAEWWPCPIISPTIFIKVAHGQTCQRSVKELACPWQKLGYNPCKQPSSPLHIQIRGKTECESCIMSFGRLKNGREACLLSCGVWIALAATKSSLIPLTVPLFRSDLAHDLINFILQVFAVFTTLPSR